MGIFKAILLLVFFSIGSNGYSQDLASLRDKYCVHPLCKAYKSGRFKKSIDYETIKIFSIPFAERKKIFPFSEYDSILIATPNFNNIGRRSDPYVDFLNPLYTKIKKRASETDLENISDILFNYYFFFSGKAGYWKVYLWTTGSSSDQYPKIILLFSKNGKVEKYLGIDGSQWNHNFSEKEYAMFDLKDFGVKEKLLLEKLKEYVDEPVRISEQSAK